MNRKYFTIADRKSAYNQIPLDEELRRLTQSINGNQQYKLCRLFYGSSIGPAAFNSIYE